MADSSLPLDEQRTVITARPPLPLSPLNSPPVDVGAARQLEGQRLGHFELQRYVGGGGMGAVYRATDLLLGREVAIKVLERELGHDEELVRRFRNEAQSTARLDHENITRVYFLGEDQGYHFIAFEFIDGENLRDLVAQRGPLPLADAILYTLQLAQAIDHASRRDVVHRDIKPSNVLVMPTGRVKLVDMGLARLTQLELQNQDLTASGVTLGTFDYISPEQARDPRTADVRSDLYSLGCTFFFMLTGRPPFPDGTVLQKLLQHQGDEPPNPREWRPELPEEVVAILRKLLGKSPLQRYQTPHELTADLWTLAMRLDLPLPGMLGLPVSPVKRRFDLARQIPWSVPVAALLAIVLLLDHFPWSSIPAASSPSELAGKVDRLGQPDAPQAVQQALLPPATGSQALPPADNAPAPGRTDAPVTIDERRDPSARRAANLAPAASARTSAGERAGTLPMPGAVEAQPNTPRAGQEPAETGAEQLARTVGNSLSRWASSWFGSPTPSAERTANSVPSTLDSALPGEREDRARTSVPRPSEFTSPMPRASAQPAPEGVLIVSDGASGPRSFRNLRSAVGQAKDGDIIELRYNGRHEEEPFTIADRQLTVRAGKGYQPIVVFRPNQLDPLRYPREMITVAGGRLTMVGVHLELDVPSLQAIPAGAWALVVLKRAEQVRMENCTLTVRNALEGRLAQHPNVAFFECSVPSGADSVMMSNSLAARELTETRLELKDCIARGEGTWLHVADRQPLYVTWNNGLLATSERMIQVAPRHSVDDTVAGRVRVELRHVTAAAAGGLLRVEPAMDYAQRITVEVDCADSLLVGAGGPFVSHEGSVAIGDLRAQLSWKGGRNFYYGYPLFFGRSSTTRTSDPISLTLEEWQELWGTMQERTLAATAWNDLPGADLPSHTHTPNDYRLDEYALENPAVGGASDSLNAGMLATALPALPGANLVLPASQAQYPPVFSRDR